MILAAILCLDCHERYDGGGRVFTGSDALFFPNVPWVDGESRATCPRCHGDRVSLNLKPDEPVEKPWKP